MTNIEIRSEIPTFDPAGEAVEDAIRGAFDGLDGEWRVEILCSRIAERWMVRIDGPAFEWYLTLNGEERRDLEAIAARFQAALRNARWGG